MGRSLRALALAILVLFQTAFAVAQAPSEQAAGLQRITAMTLTGTVADTGYGYVIQSRKGDAPGEIFTILNPDSKVLDPLVKTERVVTLEVRIVSGDNVEIEAIDGRPYRQTAP